MTHWITVISFVALLVTGVEILISHPRFYWVEVGNSQTPPLFRIPIPSSRATVPTGYAYVLPDQNGWSRYLHFEAAWALVLTGLVYVISEAKVLRNHAAKCAPRPVCRCWKQVLPEVARPQTDTADAQHPQTLLAWAMNDADLPVAFGGPLRLRVPRQLGYKNVKFVNRLMVTDSLQGFVSALDPKSANFGATPGMRASDAQPKSELERF